MDSVVTLTLALILVVTAFGYYTLYRRMRRSRMGPPKSIAVKRNNSVEESSEKNKKPSVIGMVNCEYCGSLMPQTAALCPNCGATRKK
jgi:hypothetical protein